VIPTFPKFKPIEWADRLEVEHFTRELPPYSDFNFTSLYSWNTRKKMMVSQLHQNLVLLFYDYITETPFLTFTGKNYIAETAEQLIDYSQKRWQTGILKLIPETVAIRLLEKHFSVTPDESSFDYIFDTSYLASFCDRTLSRSGNIGASFCQDNINQYPHLIVNNTGHSEIAKSQCNDLFKQWAKSKCLDHSELNEYSAFELFMQNSELEYEIVSIHDGQKLVGFAAYEILQDGYALNHFLKAEKTYKGLNERLHFEMGRMLSAMNIKYLNSEQDLGLPGLRQSKRKFKPVFFLKKYMVELI
jgi:hypothetical protein